MALPCARAQACHSHATAGASKYTGSIVGAFLLLLDAMRQLYFTAKVDAGSYDACSCCAPTANAIVQSNVNTEQRAKVENSL